jgi:hypothetical protein
LMLENVTGYGMSKVCRTQATIKKTTAAAVNAPTVGRHS